MHRHQLEPGLSRPPRRGGELLGDVGVFCARESGRVFRCGARRSYSFAIALILNAVDKVPVRRPP